MPNKLRVAYLCHFTNDHFSDILPLKIDFLTKLAFLIKRKPLTTKVKDAAIWNYYAFKEFEKFTEEVDLHVISPYPLLSKQTFHYVENGITYHFFKNEDERPDRFLFNRLTKYRYLSFGRNRKIICDLINEIHPDLIHLIGAENPYYASAILDVPCNIPVLSQLQTLLNDPEFENNYYMYKPWYNYRAETELKIFHRSDFLGTRAVKFISLIKEKIFPGKPILSTNLALTEPINNIQTEKVFDFVYFARNIAKAADWAVEAFILASRKNPGISLDIIGGYTPEFRMQLEKRLSEFGLKDRVSFEGALDTHEDVLCQVRKSRYAILPMKIDLVTGTIRECMANGIPVVTTITPASPKLNLQRETILLSEKEDFQGMAYNMCRLLDSSEFANTIRKNALLTSSESSNYDVVKQYLVAYHAIVENKRHGIPIPDELLS